jgi:hypothetical protein
MIFLMLLASAALLAGAFFLIYHLVVNVFGALLERRQRDADFVLYTGRVPPTWVKRRPRGDFAVAVARWRVRRQLAKVIDYFAHTPLVASEEERQSVLRQLREVKGRWKAAPWNEMLLP